MKTILFWASLALLVLIGAVWMVRSQSQKLNNPSEATASSTPIVTSSKTPDLTGSDKKSTPTPRPTPITADDFYKSLKPAACQIGGQIKFTSLNNAEHLKADLTYTGIDSPARLIKWQIAPSDDLKIGPNLAASLKLPDGQEHIGVVLPEKPMATRYLLTASMTYGRLVNHDIEVYEIKCQGQTEVLLNF